MRQRFQQLVRFSTVGATCLALGVGVLAGLHQLAGVNYLVAYVASFVASNIAGYLLNARFTFAVKTITHFGALRYITVNAALLCVNTMAMKFLVDGLHLWYIWAAILLAGMVTPFSFLAHRLVTYRAHAGRRLESL